MRIRDKVLFSALAMGLAITAAYAQWQVGDHAIPVGNGAGVTGFNSAVPGTAGVPLVSGGASVDPAFGTALVVGGGTGLVTISQGDLIFGSAANTYSALAKNVTATRYLSNTGASNNPAWAQITLTNGVTGALPVANGGTNCSVASGTCLDNITGFSSTGLIRRTGAGTYTFGTTTTVAEGGTGQTTLTANGILVGNGTGGVTSNLCTMDSNQDIACFSSTAFLPQFNQTNNTNDTSAAYFILNKTRAGGNTSSGDTLGNFLFRGFANSAGQNTAAIAGRQTAAASGSNIPSAIDFITSTTAGQLNKTWTIDGPATAFAGPPGANIQLQGSASGTATISTAAAAGTTTFQLPVGNGTSGFVLQTNGSGVTSWVAAAAGAVDIQVFTATGANTWTRAGGVTVVEVRVCGAGGGGGGGSRAAASTASTGGAGGGGGYCATATYKAADAGASQTVTLGTGGTAGAGATVNGNPGIVGNVGGNSTFGTLLTGFGGGGGEGGPVNTVGAGGGGGGSSVAVGQVGGGSSGIGGSSGFGSNGASSSAVNVACAGGNSNIALTTVYVTAGCPFGGAGGGGSNGTATVSRNGNLGGSASMHGPGGGGGGSQTTDNVGHNGGNGGASAGCPTPAAGGGPSGNGVSTAASFNYLPGCGGGGGGSSGAGAGAGGAGTGSGGGGGGGAGDNVNGGAGGAGGNGIALIISW